MKGSERICAALDFPVLSEAERFARRVAGSVGMLKVGLELFAAEGPSAVRSLCALGLPVFLDLKLHDIPHTVEGAARCAASLGAGLLTVHAAGGRPMIEAAVRGAGPGVRVLAVTVLTSLDGAELEKIGLSGPPEAAVVRLARLAVDAGAGGIVCSPQEVKAVRAALGPGPLLVVPGVRPAGTAKGDQSRVATPWAAVRDGADVVVVGRPLREGGDPAAAAERIAQEIEAGNKDNAAH
ncbi:MAG TPA: orotidine-5'-phosphate decarboxylase [Anaeromyxobacter sp.]|nr:orotidine-5'-phosphate decarboxylase [Anaeromyxobacter sp.]